MLKVGITGQAGFVGYHLYNFLKLQDDIETIPFEDDYFKDEKIMDEFVSKCDTIVHLAAMNRHGDPNVIYNTNIELVNKLIASMERTGSSPHVLISSSTQESRDNHYGRSKKEGRKLLIEWAERNNAPFTGMIIPNVFGPFGVPFYNSVVSTFAHQTVSGNEPKIENDAGMNLIYINDLVKEFYKNIRERSNDHEQYVPHRFEIKVSEILQKFKGYKTDYVENGVIPELFCYMDVCMFNTFRSYIPSDHFPVKYKLNTDDRGSFVEILRSQCGGQVSFSTTKPGITRGDHFHIRKVERFSVIKGKAKIQLRKIGTDEVIDYILDGSEPAYVDMPVWFTHNISNIGDEELVTNFWINEFFDPQDPDTYYEKVQDGVNGQI